jgi:curved DNA-binding protein CbpA
LINYYQILGISPDAHQYEVRQAFREKAKSLHPDVNSDQKAHEDFKRINEAYQVLCNQEKRKIYDMRLRNGVPSQKVYYRPGKVKYRAKGDKYAYYDSESDANPGFEKIEKYFDFILFLTLVIAGFFSLIYGLYRLWYEPVEEINPYPGIVMGIVFTALMIYIWKNKNKLSEDD